jgi:hypothetical protein
VVSDHFQQRRGGFIIVVCTLLKPKVVGSSSQVFTQNSEGEFSLPMYLTTWPCVVDGRSLFAYLSRCVLCVAKPTY